MLKRMDTNVMMDYIGWVSCLSHLDTNAKEGYEYYEFHTVKPLITSWSHLDTNVKDGYECYEFDIGWV